MALYTSLAEIESFHPCVSGWKRLLKGQGKTEADDVRFSISEALTSNSISDVCWLLGKMEEKELLAKFARMCANSVSQSKNKWSADAAAYAAYAAYAADAAYADAAADAAAYAADAAAYAAAYAADAAAYAAASQGQQELNKSFLRQLLDGVEAF